MQLDRETERRVWERVRGNPAMPPLKGDSLGTLEALVWENGAALLKLSRQLGGKPGEKLRKLSQEQTRLAMAVRGIGFLRGEATARSPAPAGKENPRRLLAACMARALEFVRECSHRAADPDHGPVFGALSRQGAEQAAMMAEILGEMDK